MTQIHRTTVQRAKNYTKLYYTLRSGLCQPKRLPLVNGRVINIRNQNISQISKYSEKIENEKRQPKTTTTGNTTTLLQYLKFGVSSHYSL